LRNHAFKEACYLGKPNNNLNVSLTSAHFYFLLRKLKLSTFSYLHLLNNTSVGLRITELQNHRMFRVERDLCGSSSPTPLPKQGHLQQAAEDSVQAGHRIIDSQNHRKFWVGKDP